MATDEIVLRNAQLKIIEGLIKNYDETSKSSIIYNKEIYSPLPTYDERAGMSVLLQKASLALGKISDKITYHMDDKKLIHYTEAKLPLEDIKSIKEVLIKQ